MILLKIAFNDMLSYGLFFALPLELRPCRHYMKARVLDSSNNMFSASAQD